MNDQVKQLVERMIEIRRQIDELTREQVKISWELDKHQDFEKNKVANFKASARLEGIDLGINDYE